jgi:hypothetical protein
MENTNQNKTPVTRRHPNAPTVEEYHQQQQAKGGIRWTWFPKEWEWVVTNLLFEFYIQSRPFVPGDDFILNIYFLKWFIYDFPHIDIGLTLFPKVQTQFNTQVSGFYNEISFNLSTPFFFEGSLEFAFWCPCLYHQDKKWGYVRNWLDLSNWIHLHVDGN